MSREISESSEKAQTSAARRILAAAEDTDQRFTLLMLTLPPYDPGTFVHVHQANAEGCYILEGMLAVTQGDDTITLSSGAAVHIPAGIPHSIWNPTAAPATVLLIYTPGVAAALVDVVAEGMPGEARPYSDTS